MTLGFTAPCADVRPRMFFRELERPSLALSNLTPNWFASVMGTGIVATSAATLPLHVPGMRGAATVVWLLAAVLLVVLLAATAAHWARFGDVARGHLLHPVMAHFHGAPAMALLTVGAGTVLLGTDVLGTRAAVAIGASLWTAGTAIGLASAVVVPVLTFTRHEVADDSAFAGWLMPVVPPMVSASVGALLVPHLPAGQVRETLLWACYAMFGISLFASFIVIALLWSRLARHRLGPAVMVPTLWLVLGPLGQSVTAATLLGTAAHTAVDEPLARALSVFGIVFGVPTIGFALLWCAIAATLTAHTARRGLPFSLTWWSFTFPVGTCATGAAGLALHTGAVVFAVLSVAFFVALLAAWGTVAVRTLRGALFDGRLLL